MNLSQRWKQTSVGNKLMVWTTAIVAFGTLFYAGVAVFQVCLMKKSASQTGVQIDKVIAEAKSIAESMKTGLSQSKAGLDTSIDASRLDQRAWMGVLQVTGKAEIDKPFLSVVTFKNTGKTPANRVTVAHVMESVPANGTINFAQERKIKFEDSKGIVAPQAEISFSDSTPDKLKADNIKIINSGAERVYVHGILKYDDIFGKHHWLTFCYYLKKDGEGFSACNEHNETDTN